MIFRVFGKETAMMDNLYFDRDSVYRVQSVEMASPTLRRDRRERGLERRKASKKKKEEKTFEFADIGDGARSTFNHVV